MDEISIGEMKPIVGKSSEYFLAWFVENSLAYYSGDPKKKMMAFEPLEHLIVLGRERTEAECFRDIFRALGAQSETRTQSNLRIGLAQAVERLVLEWRKSGWMQTSVENSVNLLLRTARLIGCSEIVASIETIFSDIPALFDKEETHWNTLFETIAAVATKNDADRIARMADSLYFQKYMAPMIFLALCRADKTRFPIWLHQLRPSLTQLHCDPKEQHYAYLTAQTFTRYVDIKTFANLLCLTRLSPDAEPKETDNWLLEQLVAKQESPWVLTEDHRLGWRNKELRQPVKVQFNDTNESVEYDFSATLDGMWRKSINLQPAKPDSLLERYRKKCIGWKLKIIQREKLRNDEAEART